MSRQEEEVRCATWRMHSPDRSCRYSIQDVFFWRLAGPVVPTGKAIVHWIGCINAIKIEIFPHLTGDSCTTLWIKNLLEINSCKT